MGIFNSINISTTALTAEKTRIDVISKNMANVNTTRTAGGAPYRRQIAVYETETDGSFSSIMRKKQDMYSSSNNPLARNPVEGGVRITEIVEDESDFKLKYDPGHPDADEDGYVELPNVNTVVEMVDLIGAQRSYDANVTAINSSKSMLMKALDIGRR